MVSLAEGVQEQFSYGSRAKVEPRVTVKPSSFGSLLILAVLIEIGSVGINLLASTLNIGQYYDPAQSIFGNIPAIMAGVPFAIMALVELTKIPLTLVFMNTRWLWRLLFLIGLLGMSAITFETLLMGLERASSLQSRKIEALRIEIADTRSKLSGSGDEQAAYRTRRADLNAELTSILEAERTALAQIDQRAATEQADVREQTRVLNDRLTELGKQEQIELANQTFRDGKQGVFNRRNMDAISRKFDLQRAEINRQLRQIGSAADASGERAAVVRRFADQRGPVEIQLRNLTPPATDTDADLRHQLDRQNAELSTLVNENQLYRLAATYYGHDTVNAVTKEEVKNVGIVWFSSIAALGAFAGPLLAMGSVVVSRPKPPSGKAERMFYNALRVLVARLRRRVRVEVVREVEVQVPGEPKVIRIVEEVQVPVEVEVEKKVEVEKLVKVIERIPVFVPQRDDSTRAITATN